MISALNEYQCYGISPVLPCEDDNIETDIGLTEIIPTSEENVEEQQKTSITH